MPSLSFHRFSFAPRRRQVPDIAPAPGPSSDAHVLTFALGLLSTSVGTTMTALTGDLYGSLAGVVVAGVMVAGQARRRSR
jgi:hypothetical protein